MSVDAAYPREAAVQNSPMAFPYWFDLSVASAAKTGMKLDEKSPISAITNTNCAGLWRNGKSVNPSACAMKASSRIRVPLPLESRNPPHTGDRMIVSTAGMKGMREISE